MDLEILGVARVKELLAKSDYLTPRINDNDREPSWDGYVEVYRNAGNVHKKSDLIIRVPVQVKGHYSDAHPKRISFSTSVADLNNYLNEGGTVFFVVYVGSEGERKTTYYKALLPFDLKKQLTNAAGQLTKTIHLDKFPTDKKAISNIFINFANDMKKQRASILANCISMDELMKDGQPHEITFSFTDVSKDPSRPFDYLFNNGLYLYATCEHGIKLPVEHIEGITAAVTALDNPISIGDKIYYHRYSVVHEKEGDSLAIGKGIIFKMNPTENRITITLTSKGTLDERVYDHDFIVNALDNNGFSINGYCIDLSGVSVEDRATFTGRERTEQIQFMKKALKVFEQLHVHTELDFSSLNEKSVNDLKMLMASILDGKEVSLIDTGSAAGIVTVGNIKILVTAFKNEETGLFKVEDFYSKTMSVHLVMNDGLELNVPVGLSIRRDAMMQIDNLDFPEIIEELNDFEKSQNLYGAAILFLLELLHAYDQATSIDRKSYLLAGAKQISNWISQNDDTTPKAVHSINEMQIVKRERALNEIEINQINEIIEEETEHEEILTGAYLLLDNHLSAERHFNKMDTALQEAFKSYPIYHFWT